MVNGLQQRVVRGQVRGTPLTPIAAGAEGHAPRGVGEGRAGRPVGERRLRGLAVPPRISRPPATANKVPSATYSQTTARHGPAKSAGSSEATRPVARSMRTAARRVVSGSTAHPQAHASTRPTMRSWHRTATAPFAWLQAR